ncbi:histidine phosphatase family protein [Candidatus Marinimicrobia bacterium]|nr:histidine phosphatase family protein [Candidatus Neomarinimicrobiota bacterium]
MEIKNIKSEITQSLFKNLFSIDEVVSVTIVGSFVENNDLSGISDIDTVVICNSLNQNIFNKCLDAVNKIDIQKCGLIDFTLKINSTFGPLKFDGPKIAVIHLMVYDVIGHVNHVKSSPFTCYDWERSRTYKGLRLKEIFPVGRLQIRDFMEVRRSTNNYIKDIENNSISYREYKFNNESYLQEKKFKKLDNKHIGEYAFHIFKNLTINYIKLINQKNISLFDEELSSRIYNSSINNNNFHSKNFLKLSKLKKLRSESYPKETKSWIRSFLFDFLNMIDNDWMNSKKIYFVRHYKTSLNDGSFLGQGRDPSIVANQTKLNIKNDNVSIVFTSPLKRAVQTSHYNFPRHIIKEDQRLCEINYGLAEGMFYNDFISTFPNIKKGWDNGLDMAFPKGESNNDVLNRLKIFLADLNIYLDKSKQSPVAVISHNCVLRCLLGYFLDVDADKWHLLNIPHAKPIEFLYNDGKYFCNVKREDLYKILAKFSESKI